MMGFWIFLIGIGLYLLGTFIEYVADVIHGGRYKEEEDEDSPLEPRKGIAK